MVRPDKGTPSILHTLGRDGTLYFAVIFTSHIIYTFMLILGRVSNLVLKLLCCEYFHFAYSLNLQPFVQLIPAGYGFLFPPVNSDLLPIFPPAIHVL